MKATHQARRQQQLDRLYRAYSGKVRRRCQQLLKDPHAAEDAVQDVFMRVYAHLDSAPKDDQAFNRYLNTISTRLCLTRIRDRNSRAEKLGSLPVREADEFEPRIIDRQLVSRLVADAITDHRVPIVLHCVDEVDQQSVANRVGKTRETINAWVRKWRANAREFLVKVELGEG